MRNNRPAIIIGSVVGVLLLVTFFLFRGQSKKKFDWEENYRMENKQPYGCYVVKQLLYDYFDGHKFRTIENSFAQDFDGQTAMGNYVYIGTSFEPNNKEIDDLLSFAARGNTVFISTSDLPDSLFHKVFTDSTCANAIQLHHITKPEIGIHTYDNGVKSDSTYHFQYLYKNVPSDYDWAYWDSSCTKNSAYFSLGKYDSTLRTNYLLVHYQKGQLLFHTTPIAFSNISLLSKTSLDYAGHVFSYLQNGDIWWDEATKNDSFIGDNSMDFTPSPFQFILSQRSLKWAWYLLIFFTGLYLFFGARRKQKAIPVIEPNTNTSLEFVSTISELYYQQKDHAAIARHMYRLFLSFIRNRYYLATNLVDKTLMEKIAEKSGIEFDRVNSIFAEYSVIQKFTEVDADSLIRFHQNVEHFYKNCK